MDKLYEKPTKYKLSKAKSKLEILPEYIKLKSYLTALKLSHPGRQMKE